MNNVINLPIGTPTSRQQVSTAGSGGGGDDMTWRIERLETDVRDIKGTLASVEKMLIKIDETLKHIPNTFSLVCSAIFIALAASALPLGYLQLTKPEPQPVQQQIIKNEPQRSPTKK